MSTLVWSWGFNLRTPKLFYLFTSDSELLIEAFFWAAP